jgi:CHASE2 domain-containing sensor protein
MSHSDDHSPARWSESPWLWFFLFAAAALVALAVIGPKHVRRQQRLVRMQQARERTAASQSAGQPREAGGQPATVPEAAVPRQPVVSVWPLMAFLVLLVAAVGLGFIITMRRRTARLAAAEKHPP